jgi:hypothetical protein
VYGCAEYAYNLALQIPYNGASNWDKDLANPTPYVSIGVRGRRKRQEGASRLDENRGYSCGVRG